MCSMVMITKDKRQFRNAPILRVYSWVVYQQTDSVESEATVKLEVVDVVVSGHWSRLNEVT